jgi:alginate O-acetyltransferase complex protein AlgI
MLTFFCVLLGQVFFRADSVHDAMLMLERMIGMSASPNTALVEIKGMHLALLMMVVGGVIVWCFPNTQQILARYKPALELAPSDEQPRLLPIYWKPSIAWAMTLGVVVLASLVMLQNPSSFLYFQF